ncbi:MAG: hypothetical protein ABS75_18580 [Pelagibacterium sp. SCN 63-23]|nr:MAG: hypothetical protein ABS75_18580 [Pelagibacterium sp. SCN 63-23]
MSDNVLAIILPQLYLDDLDLATSVYGMGAKHVLPYPSMTRMGSEFLAGHIYGMIEKIYLDEGYIQK